LSDRADILANVVLVLTALSPLLMAWQHSCRRPLNVAQSLAWSLAAMLTLFMWRTRLRGRIPQLPAGAMLIANHRSSADGFFVQMACSRPLGFMVAREYLDIPLLGTVLRFLDVIPAGRKGMDTGATKRAIREASSGRWVLMFPEGRLNVTEKFMQSARPGAIMIAVRSGVPVVPCYLENLQFSDKVLSPFYMFGQVTVHVGKPIDVAALAKGSTDRKVLAEITCLCLREIAKLAGNPDWQPRLAGRDWLHDSD